MYVQVVPNRGSRPTILLREGYREGGKVKNRTLANLTHWPAAKVEALRQVLRGETLVAPDTAFEVVSSKHHGHVEAVLAAMGALGFEKLIATEKSPERDLVVAMVVSRLIAPSSKLATPRWWETTTLPELLGIRGATEEDLYAAMDWLVARQRRIEKKLAARHLRNDGLVLYDLSSSYFEGKTCPLAARGHNRDGKKGKLQVNYGLLTDARGRPVSVSVFPGNTGDPTTVLAQVDRVQQQFGVKHLVLVGDRGMLTQKQIDACRDKEGVDWIGALRPDAIRALVEGGQLQMGLFDDRNLFELTHPDFPGERLVACRNLDLEKHRRLKRQALLDATAKELEKVRITVENGRLRGQDRIGVRVGRVVNKYKMAKHFDLTIEETSFAYSVNAGRVAEEAALDGMYVVRTSLPAVKISAAEAVRSYKRLTQVERAFRSFKTVDLMVRPIHHRLEMRVRAHIFLCMLAYYVKWHMAEAWRPMLFSDEDQEAKATRDPVAPAQRSPAALRKAHLRTTEDGAPAHSFKSLMRSLATRVRNRIRALGAGGIAVEIDRDTTPNPRQAKAMDLLKGVRALAAS